MELRAFAAVAAERSFRRAATKLAVTPSTLSHSLKSLEERLGVRLLNRTTRTVTPTEAGQTLLDQLSPAFLRIDKAMEGIHTFNAGPQGTLRLNVPHMAARRVLAPVFARYAQAYPEVTLDVSANDGFVDIVKAGFDAGIRLGESIDQDMTAMRVSPDFTAAIVGSPDYFASHPPPRTPQDLQKHLCIGRRDIAGGALHRWEFEKNGKSLNVPVTGPLVLDDAELMISAALDGVGLAYTAESGVIDDLASGRLVRVLRDWSRSIPGFFLYYPGRRQISAALLAMIEMLRTRP